MKEEEEYSWSQDLRDWDERQDKYERWELNNRNETSDLTKTHSYDRKNHITPYIVSVE